MNLLKAIVAGNIDPAHMVGRIDDPIVKLGKSGNDQDIGVYRLVKC